MDGVADLLKAAYKGDFGTVEGLLEDGVDFVVRDSHHWTSLMVAAYHGDLVVVDKLLASNPQADVNAADHLHPTLQSTSKQ